MPVVLLLLLPMILKVDQCGNEIKPTEAEIAEWVCAGGGGGKQLAHCGDNLSLSVYTHTHRLESIKSVRWALQGKKLVVSGVRERERLVMSNEQRERESTICVANWPIIKRYIVVICDGSQPDCVCYSE